MLRAERAKVARITSCARADFLYKVDSIRASCVAHHNCARIWTDQWTRRVGDELLHPDDYMSLDFDSALRRLKELKFEGMTPSCKELYVKMAEESGAFQVVERYAERAFIKLRDEVPMELVDIVVT